MRAHAPRVEESEAAETGAGNVAALVLRQARCRPNRTALVIPRSWTDGHVTRCESVTFGELQDRLASFAHGLRRAGLRGGDRVVLLLPVSIDLYALALALLSSGLTAVLIDAGLGRGGMMRAIRDARAAAVVSVSTLLRHRFVLPALWGRRLFSADSSGLFVTPLASLRDGGRIDLEVVSRNPGDEALITFTSGTTARPKAADRTHGLLLAQHRALLEAFPEAHGEVDMPGFPVVALHNLASGLTTVLPAVDLRAPATVEPAVVLRQIRDLGVTRVSGAPAYIERVADFMERTGTRVPTVVRVTVGGGPASVDLCARVQRVFPQAVCRVVYGSTEAEPIASVEMDEVVAGTGEGCLVGHPTPRTEVALVSLPDLPPRLDARGLDPYRVGPGETGEVVVRGPHVNRRYVDNPQANRETKLASPDGSVWHRTGDTGQLDRTGRLWLTGRVGSAVRHRGRVLEPFPIEGSARQVRGVRHAALVAHERAPEGELVVELESGSGAALETVREMLTARGLGSVRVRTVERIPMDLRHNSKVDRAALRREGSGL